MSIKQIFKNVIVQNPEEFKYLLTHKLSLDHLDLFFNAISARGGWCQSNGEEFQLSFQKIGYASQYKIFW